VKRAALAVLVLLAVSGCGLPGLYGITLPGGADVGAHPYRVRAQFANVLDLVPQSAVRVNDVPVGRVEKIELDGWMASVTLLVNGDVRLPANAHAELRQTSLLGEKYVSLGPPTAEPPEGRLGDGALIPLAHTNRNPEVEEVLAALSLLLNGGGVEQLQVITHELNQALSGRETELRGLLGNLNTFIAGLDTQKSEITRALDGIDKLARTLNANKAAIAKTLDTLPGALKVLSDQRGQLTAMLTALSKLGQTGTRVINGTRADLLADLASLRPTLRALADAGDALPKSLGFLLTFPFPDTALAGIHGDYANAFITLDADVLDLLRTVSAQRIGGNPGNTPPGTQPPAVLPRLPGVPTLPGTSGGTGALPELPVPSTPAPPAGPPGVPDLVGILLGGGP
jgi:phospholipid/cholesterol/gamma-HCH transport system substrate-binding protein